MRFKATAAALVGLAAVSALAPPARARQAPTPSARRSVWDGVYSEAQEKRGAAIYSRECSTCHGETLKGGEGSPPLAGSDFIANWNGRTLADLFDKIRQTMPAPPEQPGKLSAQQTADVVAHLLRVNEFPAGTPDLPADLEALKRIRISASNP